MGSKKKRLQRVPELKRRLNQINIELREWKRGGKKERRWEERGEELGVADG